MRYLLIVEDEQDLRAVYEGVFQPPKYEVMAVANGKDATRLIRRSKFEVIITDLRMPWVDGIELYKRTRASKGYEETPIVFVTGFAAEIPATIVSDENVSVIEKPVDMAMLTEHVDKLLDLVQKREEDKPKSKIDIELIEMATKITESTMAHMSGVENLMAQRPFVFRRKEPIVSDVVDMMKFETSGLVGMMALLYRTDAYLWLAAVVGSTTYKSVDDAISDQGGRVLKMIQRSLWRKLGIQEEQGIEFEVIKGKPFQPEGTPPIIVPLRTGFGEVNFALGAKRP